ncbi:MAG: hypothetical protein LAO21_18035 [Acidobacteriia bacterium]|nr:hypothetical protein [Terriglobia bacterium]
MKRTQSIVMAFLFAVLILVFMVVPLRSAGGGWTLIGWNNLGMHCMDSDFSVFAILPPYNTVVAQLVDPSGRLVKNPAGITVTYQAIADPDGSMNQSSVGKTNFWQYVLALFGANRPPDAGLAGKSMPGAANTPQAMTYDATQSWFIGEGIPLTPYDDNHLKNYYPMMHLVARDAAGNALAQTDVVLPVSDEMDCRACHSSGSTSGAQPPSGWVSNPDPVRDFRLNILRLHDDRNAANPNYQRALATAGYNTRGLYVNVVNDGQPILCAKCHSSEALGTSGAAGVPPLTRSVHDHHSGVTDPTNGLTLEASKNRSACYRCHPGSTTLCLRGAMGKAVAADGSMEMQCQSCHGPMSAVGAPNRTGWLNEPSCQNCHTGTAVVNGGQIRFTSAFGVAGQLRQPADSTFATNANTPAAGLSLYRFSQGHGGLQCEACHGSTHAEYPTSHRNDNIQSQQLQGHVGMLADCTTCHGVQPSSPLGGPHGMHPVGPSWVRAHSDVVGDNKRPARNATGPAPCQACHGADYRGTVLSRSQADRSLTTEFGAKQFWRGFQIGCYTCHNGPQSDSANPNHAPVANNASASTVAGTPVTIPLSASDVDGNPLTVSIYTQPTHGTAGISGMQATYLSDPSFSGVDTFTFAAWDGSTNSNLATVSVTVTKSGGGPTGYQAMLPSSHGVSVASSGQGELTVVYGQVTFQTPSAPVALANYSLTQGGVLVTEVGIPASSPITSGRLFVDLAPGTNSGVALVNPGGSALSILAEARDSTGAQVSQSTIAMDRGSHKALFVDQMGLNLPATFLGTLTLSSASPFAAVNLRSATNGHGEPIYTALPLADLNNPPAGARLIFSQIVDGGGAPTEILLMNPSSSTTSTGTINLCDESGTTLPLDFGAGAQSTLNYSIPPNGMVKFATTGVGSLRAGYAIATSTGGSLPVGSSVFSTKAGSSLVSQAGVFSAPLTTSSRMYVQVAPPLVPRDTGIAIVNPNPSAVALTLTLVGFDNSTRSIPLSVPANGHVAKFITQIFTGLPANFQGILTMTSSLPVAPLTLQMTTNQRGESIFSTLPVADLNHPPANSLFVPQVVDGGGYRTQFIFLNTAATGGMVQLNLFSDSGLPVNLLLQ